MSFTTRQWQKKVTVNRMRSEKHRRVGAVKGQEKAAVNCTRGRVTTVCEILHDLQSIALAPRKCQRAEAARRKEDDAFRTAYRRLAWAVPDVSSQVS
jgi:hypothetical protein